MTSGPPQETSEIKSGAREERIVDIACHATEKISSESVFKSKLVRLVRFSFCDSGDMRFAKSVS